MNHICFSRQYPKLIDKEKEFVKEAYLISVCKVYLPDLPFRFLNYDTTYEWKNGRPIQYPLNAEDYIILTFYANDYESQNLLFTTIRPHTKEKESYYRCKIGQLFEIIIEEKDQNG